MFNYVPRSRIGATMCPQCVWWAVIFSLCSQALASQRVETSHGDFSSADRGLEASCSDNPVGWVDRSSRDCAFWSGGGGCGPSGRSGDDPQFAGTDAKTSNQACCDCGGGFKPEICDDGCTCPKGAYCTAYFGNEVDYIIPCSVGTFNPNEGATSADACVACSAGTVCPEGSSTETICANVVIVDVSCTNCDLLSWEIYGTDCRAGEGSFLLHKNSSSFEQQFTEVCCLPDGEYAFSLKNRVTQGNQEQRNAYFRVSGDNVVAGERQGSGSGGAFYQAPQAPFDPPPAPSITGGEEGTSSWILASSSGDSLVARGKTTVIVSSSPVAGTTNISFTSCKNGHAAWESGDSDYDVSFINHKALTSTFCSETAVNSFPFTAWHRSEATGFIAGVTNKPPTRFVKHGTFNFGFLDEFGDAMLGLVGGAETTCGKSMTEWFCLNVQPQSRFDPATESRSACPVCRNVCEEYLQSCEASALESLYAVGASFFYPGSNGYENGLCDLSERSVAEKNLAAIILANCSKYPVTGSSCTSGDSSTCAQPAVAPAAVFGVHSFLGQTAADSNLFRNEIQGLANEENAPSELRSTGRGVGLDAHGSILIPPGSTLVLVGAAVQPETRLGGRVNQYTIVSGLWTRANKSTSNSLRPVLLPV